MSLNDTDLKHTPSTLEKTLKKEIFKQKKMLGNLNLNLNLPALCLQPVGLEIKGKKVSYHFTRTLFMDISHLCILYILP